MMKKRQRERKEESQAMWNVGEYDETFATEAIGGK